MVRGFADLIVLVGVVAMALCIKPAGDVAAQAVLAFFRG